MREALLAYTFLLPSIIIIGLFGLFPLAFAVYESTLTGLNKIVGNYDGLGNYVKAVDNLAYVLGFWMAAALAIFAVRSVRNRRNVLVPGERTVHSGYSNTRSMPPLLALPT